MPILFEIILFTSILQSFTLQLHGNDFMAIDKKN